MSDASAIKARASLFDATLAAASTFDVWVEEAIIQHDKTKWGKFETYRSAMAAWALHQQAVTAPEAGGAAGVLGPIQSQRTLDVSVTYGTAAGSSGEDMGDYARSAWGRMYYRLRSSRASVHCGIATGR